MSNRTTDDAPLVKSASLHVCFLRLLAA